MKLKVLISLLIGKSLNLTLKRFLTKETKLNLIDLEFSFNNFIYVDLGNIICEYYTNYHDEEYNYNLKNNKIKEKILEYYNLAKNKINLEKINIGIDISHLYWLIWGLLVDVIENKNGFDYIKFAKSRYECIKY